MRKWMAVCLALALLFSLSACGSDGEEKEQPVTEAPLTTEPLHIERAGCWEVFRIDSETSSMDEETLALTKAAGMVFYLDLQEDGTGTFNMGEEKTVTWDNGKLIFEEGMTAPYTLDGDCLVLSYGANSFVMRRAEQTEQAEPQIPELVEAGFTQYMEEGVTYSYTTICSEDESKTTTGEVTVIAYDVFEWDETHPKKENYEWRVVELEARFFDENAQAYGTYVFTRHEDLYNVKLHDDSEAEYEESDDYSSYSYTRIHQGQEVETYARVEDSWSDWQTDAEGNDECFYRVKFAFQVPVGYDGVVVAFEDGGYTYPEGAYLTELDPAYFLLFRLD